MNLILTRLNTSLEGTFGELRDEDGQLICYTGELPKYAGKASVQNERQTDCIPYGTYACSIVNSPKFGYVYGVADVPCRSAILIHAGNFCGDKKAGYRSDVEGCVLLGQTLGHANGQRAVLNSKAAIQDLYKYTDRQDFTLIIREEFQ